MEESYIEFKSFPSQIRPVSLCTIASEHPPSLPPIDPIPYEAASIKEIPKPSTELFSILLH